MASGGDAFDLWPLEVSQEQVFYSLHPARPEDRSRSEIEFSLFSFSPTLMNKCTKLNNISHTILAKFTGPSQSHYRYTTAIFKKFCPATMALNMTTLFSFSFCF